MLFRHGADTDKRTPGRSRESSEAQLKELRAKARRRLIGALALVLAAVIVVPWFFQEPVTDDTHAPVVIPAAPGGLPPLTSPQTTGGTPDAVAQADNPQTDAAAAGQDGAQPANPDAAAGVVTAPPQPPVVASTAPAAAPETAPAPPEPRPAAKPTPPPRVAEPEKPAKKPTERTDDGSVALALLAGKTPAPSAAAKPAAGQGRYYLQVAAYTTEQDAQSRRDSLRQAGVTDAYVERGQSSGRTVYRLRVGPFGSHEAAQAAQARLRALGYQNGLISGN